MWYKLSFDTYLNLKYYPQSRNPHPYLYRARRRYVACNRINIGVRVLLLRVSSCEYVLRFSAESGCRRESCFWYECTGLCSMNREMQPYDPPHTRFKENDRSRSLFLSPSLLLRRVYFMQTNDERARLYRQLKVVDAYISMSMISTRSCSCQSLKEARMKTKTIYNLSRSEITRSVILILCF